MGHFEPLSIPEQPLKVQLANKMRWNLQRSPVNADFYTTGYAGRSVIQFTRLLQSAGVSTVVDIRQNAVSPYKPEFSKTRLKLYLEKYGLLYLHRADLGVPRDVRAMAMGQKDRSSIWEWYDSNVVRAFVGDNLDEFFNWAEHPVAFMCVESDPYACHRHRLAVALERHGLRGYDL